MEKLDLDYITKFQNLSYEKFKDMAANLSLLPNERVGFPESYRAGKIPLIWQDICSKLTNLHLPRQLILDIGPGCSELSMLFLDQAKKNNSKIILCDSHEMLCQLPQAKYIEKIEGPFPNCWSKCNQYIGLVDVIIVYSVFHYVMGIEKQEFFLDCCLDLLASGGQLLFGDLPNESKRMRFLNSPAGREFSKTYNGSKEKNQFDDRSIFSLIARARKKEFDAYIMPQAAELPMANRREDILIVRQG